MELVSAGNQLVELKELPKSYQELLETQKALLLNQFENLHRVVAVQCDLTGVNPLSQEMAAGALSIKIGKKPRDLLTSKAVKYMQSVFSIKDVISKKEMREISAQFGITTTQIKDFLNGHRSRVRKSLRLAAEKANKSTALAVKPDGMASTSDFSMPAEPVPLDTICPVEVEEGPSCSTQHEVLPGMEEPERNFVENIFKLMRKEESFSGQVKLLEWILRTGNPSMLDWFLKKGGIMILVTWLSEAAKDEQTSVIGTVLEVLCHLPLKKASRSDMSAVLQGVNSLRHYQKPDISSRSRDLLAQWSKQLFRRMLSDPKQGQSAIDAQEEMLLKQSIDEVMGDEAWDSKEDNSERPLRLLGNPGYHMKLDRDPSVKLLTSSADGSKNRRGTLSSHTRQRRKVQMVEQPGQRSVVRNLQVSKSTISTKSRPLSADDIQKAKMRAQFMQNKNGKTIKGSNVLAKPESQNKINHLLARASTSGSSPYVRPELCERKNVDKLEERKKVESSPGKVAVDKLEEWKKVETSPGKLAINKLEEQKQVESSPDKLAINKLEEQKQVESSPDKVANLQVPVDFEEPPWKRCKRTQIPWRVPPEIRVPESWSVGTGANSKEVEVQNNRIKRERETIYRYIHEIPPNPREPWDREMDYVDTLTPVIPTEQLPEVEQLETPTAFDIHNNGTVSTTTTTTGHAALASLSSSLAAFASSSSSLAAFASSSGSHAASASSSTNMPDLKLLAELLKNPGLVFALYGQGCDNDTMKLLDLIKANGASGLVNLAGGINGNAENRVEVSLPSPTPSTEPVPNGVRPDFSRNPFTKQQATVNGNVYQTVAASTLVQPQIPVPQPSVQHLAHAALPVASLQTANQLSEQWHTPNPVIHHSLNSQHLTPETMMNANNKANFNRASSSNTVHSVAPSYTLRAEPLGSNSNFRARSQVQQEVQYPYYEEPAPRARQEYEPSYHHQNSRNMNNYNGYAGSSVQMETWDGRNRIPDRPVYDLWSSDNSPPRGYGYMPGRSYQDRGVDGYRPDRAVRQNPGYGYRDGDVGGSGYRDNGVGGSGDRRWQSYRR